MTALAGRLLRHRWGTAVATLVALVAAIAILTGMGTLVESGLRYRAEPHRYAGADLVVARPEFSRTTTVLGDTTTTTVRLPDGGAVPSSLAGKLARVPGVNRVGADAPVPIGNSAATGHGWSTAEFAGDRLVAGAAPTADDQVVVGRGAGTPGRTVELVVGGVERRFTVSGVIDGTGGTDAVYFTDARAAALSPTPGRVTAIALRADPSAVAAVTALADASGARVFTGDDRARAEPSADLDARDLLIQLCGAFGGYVVLLVGFVVAGTVGLSVRHRRRDLALLRAIAATPGQVRRLLLAEAILLSGVGAVLGVPLGLLATRWVHGQLVGHRFVPESFPVVPGALAAPAAVLVTTLVAVLATLAASRRVTAIRPTEALGEAAVETGPGRPVRLVSGLVTLVGAITLSTTTLGRGGVVAVATATGMLYLFVIAVGLLAPWINRYVARVLDPVLRALWGSSGYLAAANLRANARGAATVLTALVLAVGLGGSVWFLQDNLERATVDQRRDGMLAQHALVSPAGLPSAALADVRAVPGVTAATPVRTTSVVVPVFDGLEGAGAQGVDPATLARTVDLDVTDGSLDRLGPTTVAVSTLRASSSGWGVGDDAEFVLADGTPVTLEVAAIYRRGFGFADVTMSTATVAGHTRTGLDDQILIRSDPGVDTAGLTAVAAKYPGGAVVGRDQGTAGLAEDLAVSAWANKLLIGVLVGYAALAAANTMVVAALARRRELAVLRLVGLTTRQVKRMVHAEQAGLLGAALVIGGVVAAWTLASVVRTLTGSPVPYVPPLGLAAVVGGATLLALATTVLPIGRLLRTPPAEQIGIRE